MNSSIPDTLASPFPWPRPPVEPPEAYAWLRENEPVRRVITADGTPAWLVTRYDDVRSVLSDPRVSADSRAPGFLRFGAAEPAGHLSFLRMDPPEHTVFRRLLGKHFIVKNIQAMRPQLQQLVDDHIDNLLESSSRSADLVEQFTLPIPSTVLSWLLGIPQEDQAFFNKVAEEMLSRSDPNKPDGQDQAVAAREQAREYIGAQLDRRMAAPSSGDDILGALAISVRDGQIGRTEAVRTGVTVLVAGHETTSNMTALGTATLLQHPEQLAHLKAQPDLLAGAIEELLRYLTVVHLIVVRVAAEDVEVGSVTIPAGEAIIPLNFAANRDDAHYDRANELDIHRAPRDHVAFGFGVHQCLGQPLARLELHVMLETLLRRIPTLQLGCAPDELPYKWYAPINGLRSLPVTW